MKEEIILDNGFTIILEKSLLSTNVCADSCPIRHLCDNSLLIIDHTFLDELCNCSTQDPDKYPVDILDPEGNSVILRYQRPRINKQKKI